MTKRCDGCAGSDRGGVSLSLWCAAKGVAGLVVAAGDVKALEPVPLATRLLQADDPRTLVG
jgi:hypothetical protein